MPPSPPSPSPPAGASKQGIAKQLMYKNQLQEYAQKHAMPIPLYQTVNEGFAHAPEFRATVVIDGETFRSRQTFAHRKEAEQDVAKIALEGISKSIKTEDFSLIPEDFIFCKSTLYEYSVKMNLPNAKYTTSTEAGFLPSFVSSVNFDGKTYIGYTGKNKTEAEQLAARAAIESILANSSTKTVLSKIIKSKRKLYAPLHKGSGPGSSQEEKLGQSPQSLNSSPEIKGNNMQRNLANGDVLGNNIAYTAAGQHGNAVQEHWLPPDEKKHHEYIGKSSSSSGKKHKNKYQGGQHSKKARADQWW